MKIEFADKSYIELNKQEDSIIITVAARSNLSELTTVVNSVKLNLEQFNKLTANVT